MIILGIETSCDETAAAVVRGRRNRVEILSNIVSSQIETHKKYKGIIPELAAREHVLNILPVINEALGKAGIKPPSPPFTRGAIKKVDAIAVTLGPGLITSLLVGVETAKVLSYVWQIPITGINHIEGHIYANFISANPKSQIPNPKQITISKSQILNKYKIQKIKFPAVILTVSGGHTMLVLMKNYGKYKILGETRDDAAGEAFDKAAQILGLEYPGGPAISAYAEKFQVPSPKRQTNASSAGTPQNCGMVAQATKSQIKNSKLIQNNKSTIVLPRPMIKDRSLDFSFSGLKTALLYEVSKDSLRQSDNEASKNWKKRKAEYAHEFQQAVIDVLVTKTIRAVKEYKVKTVMLSGGVAANDQLRQQLKAAVREKLIKVNFIMPDLKYCTDNAAMIAAAGYWRAKQHKFTPWQKLKVDCNLELK